MIIVLCDFVTFVAIHSYEEGWNIDEQLYESAETYRYHNLVNILPIKMCMM